MSQIPQHPSHLITELVHDNSAHYSLKSLEKKNFTHKKLSAVVITGFSASFCAPEEEKLRTDRP